MKALVAIAMLSAALLAGTMAGCGEKEEPENQSAPSIAGNAGAEEKGVIRAWVDALRGGDVRRAASYFALPGVVENGTAPIRIETRREAQLFNRSLPCGARLLRAEAAGRFITATFRLTERPGGACGAGTGHTARTTFVIRDGKIVEWRRVSDQPQGSGELA